MAIPDYQAIMLPLLQLSADGEDHGVDEAVEPLAEHFGLTQEETSRLYPTGRKPIFRDRIAWARTYMAQAGLLESPKRKVFRITARGQDLLSQKPKQIDCRMLRKYPEFREFESRSRKAQPKQHDACGDPAATPEEMMQQGYSELRERLELDLLARVRECEPSFFEQLVVDLLVAMGYGGSRQDAGKAVGRSGDAGIDGVINEDKLGLDVVYVQAKRWTDKVVGRPEIQQFVGALQGQRASKGVFITTSSFTGDAADYARSIGKVILIDGQRLAGLMAEHNVGVSTVATYELKKVDSDYFAAD